MTVPYRQVVLVGPYPPPMGGVASHIVRAVELLSASGVSVGVANHFRQSAPTPCVVAELKRNPLRYWSVLRRIQSSLVHYHHSRWSTLLATALAFSGKPRCATLITVHSHDLDPYLDSRFGIVRRLTRWALRQFDQCIAVSDAVAANLATAVAPDRLDVLPAYLGRGETTTGSDDPRLAGLVGRGAPLIVASAYRMSVARGRPDVYGFDVAVRIFRRVSAGDDEVRLALFLAREPTQRRNRRYLDSLLAELDGAGLHDRVALFIGCPLVPALGPGVVYLRPTRTDGDAVSVREALDRGATVIASDVVARPDGVIGMPLTDIASWAEAARAHLSVVSRAVPADGCDPASHALLRHYQRLAPSLGIREPAMLREQPAPIAKARA